MSNTLKALLLMSLVPAGSACAQAASPAGARAVKFCGNALVANTVSSTAKSVAPGAEVEYHAEFQNMDTHGRIMTATMVELQKVGTFTVLRPLHSVTLTSYQKKDVTLFSIKSPNQASIGVPAPALVMNTIRIDCTYR
jgi:hypothetical protein